MDNKVEIVPVEETEQNNEKQDKVVVYENGISTVDFMLPEDERSILEENLNTYSNVEAMQKTLKEAQKNMKLRQNVKDLKLMEKYSELIDITQETQKEMLDIILQPEYFQALAKKKPEEAFKALKHLGDFNKTNVEARDTLARKLTGNTSNKKFKINLKFSNDSGEEMELGVEN